MVKLTKGNRSDLDLPSNRPESENACVEGGVLEVDYSERLARVASELVKEAFDSNDHDTSLALLPVATGILQSAHALNEARKRLASRSALKENQP